MKGKIIKGIGGFYYVHIVNKGNLAADVYECKAKGIFRKEKIKPLVGDDVEIDVLDEADKEGNITLIYPRTSELVRPAVANIDQALVIFAVQEPKPNFNLLDRFLVTMERSSVPVSICFNKQDLTSKEELQFLADNYGQCSQNILFTSAEKGIGIESVKELLSGKTTAVAGPSGVGKSSLINLLQDSVKMDTGEISKKIGRGKHTTRHSELIYIDDHTYVMDTPGFSSLFIQDFEKEELKEYFPEFKEWEPECRFQGCSHIHEPGCGVKAAVADARFSQLRYDNYVMLYEELKNQRRY